MRLEYLVEQLCSTSNVHNRTYKSISVYGCASFAINNDGNARVQILSAGLMKFQVLWDITHPPSGA
jgi:hypothetical protein